MGQTTPSKNHIVAISENRRARFDYEILETFECGLVLLGTEVKSLRDKHVSFSDAYAIIKGGEVFLLGLNIEPYKNSSYFGHTPDRTRKLLLNAREIKKISKALAIKGQTLVPLKLYFKNGRAKVLIGIAKGKSSVDKRDTIKKRDTDRQIARVMRRG
jgi:SsrA-binding protein